MSSSNDAKDDDALMAPIPRKKRPSQVGESAHSEGLSSVDRNESSNSFPTIPRKPGAKRPPSTVRDKGDRFATSLSSKKKKNQEKGAGRSLHAGDNTQLSQSRSSLVQWVSENPMVLRIKISMESLDRQRTSQRKVPKRTRPVYQEQELTDSDDFMTDDEQAPPKKKGRLVPFSAISAKPAAPTAGQAEYPEEAEVAIGASGAAPHPANMVVDPENMTPPEGTLSTLWYSREDFDQLFVLEKVVGYRTRPIVQLIKTESNSAAAASDDAAAAPAKPEPHVLDTAAALHIQQVLLQSDSFWPNAQCRMQISRLVPQQCPSILVAAALREQHLAKQEGRDPSFRLDSIGQHEQQEEEVLLAKWRGRSHMHCSWERASDIQRLDTSNNSMARNKIRRYYQAQETAHGIDWKKMSKTPQEEGDQVSEGEEYFPVQCLEIERILGCDETEMNMEVLAKQRGRNAQKEQEALARREDAPPGGNSPIHESSAIPETAVPKKLVVPTAYEPLCKLLEEPDIVSVLSRKDAPWDPEDNVRYIVKWKGLPYAEITWEYWRNIKLDAVDLAEDYWYRQQVPTDGLQSKPHPHVRDFKKLQESPVFGLSSRPRPCIGYEDAEKEDAFKGFKLRAYQLEGVNWLVFNWWNRRSCVLADEMGLGKTIQSTAFLRELQTNANTQIRGPFLIVAPLSLAGQWQSELASWAPDMNVVLYHGSADARDFLVREEFYFNEPFVNKQTAAKLKKQHVTKFHVLITTYEVVLKDSSVLSKIRWKALIVDEAHRLKNHRSRLFDELAAVPRDHCLLLTGTPIANATEELWALLHFANPKAFTNREEFLKKFGEMTDVQQVNELHTLLRPYLLRRVKEDVEKSLPPKEETILEVSLTPIQKAYYKAIYERNTSFLFKGAKSSNAPSLMNVMMELRKCCNHPFLVKGAEERILADAAAKLQEKDGGEAPALDYVKLFGDQLVKSSGKMVLLEKLLQKLFDGGHKVLIFSQMVKVLDLLEELLKIKKYRYERLDGSTSSSSRAASVDRFTRKSCQRFVMLLSTRAGGLGLNLTAADVVIIFDSDWNPQNDLQAMARAHRIGQERRVMIYRVLTAKTYEMHMFHSASLKLGLERAVMSGSNREQNDDSEDKPKKKDRDAQAKEIDELLKKGAYDVFRDDDDTEAEKFMETDIDQLLEHSSKKVTYGASATSSLGSGLGSFSKASFVADTEDGAKDVDLDDPDFWSKAVGLDTPVETSEEVAAMLDDGVKRNRKQVQVYDPYAETAEAEMRKKEKLALEKQLEKEEKERQRLEKKKLKEAAKEKKKKDREEQQKMKEQAAKHASAKVAKDELGKKPQAEQKPKKSKKGDRQRAMRRAENENPVLEQLKQAWEVSQRNRATAAVLRFGFARFCKVRHESNITSLPLQDLEIFTRAYLYQIALQVGVVLLEFVRDRGNEDELPQIIKDWLGASMCQTEFGFLLDSILSVMQCHDEVENYRRFLRMPVILAEPAYVADLRRGGGFRALRRIGVLSRLNAFVEHILDEILSNLGHEELGKRGCAYGDLSCLDVDLKVRFVTTEELTLAVGTSFGHLTGATPPALWWDRECDVCLILGTFIHGLGNYSRLAEDTDLCFTGKMKALSDSYTACKEAVDNFSVACRAARKVFDEALEAGRVKAELEVQAAVAAAAKAAKKREEDAALLREGGEGVEAAIKNMPETQVENAFEFDGTDSHFVTLGRIQRSVRSAVTSSRSSPEHVDAEDAAVEGPDEPAGKGPRQRELIPMPDARVLDHRLLLLLAEIDEEPPNASVVDLSSWPKPKEVEENVKARNHTLTTLVGTGFQEWTNEFSGVGLGSYQCGTTHRNLNDGSDYGHGSATSQLAQVAYGTDAPRYLRQVGVPMNLTRYAVAALVHADPSCVEALLKGESLKYFGNTMGKPDEGGSDSEAVKSEKKEPTDHVPGTPVPAKSPKDKSKDKVSRIPEEFRNSAQLRAATCLIALLHGHPTGSSSEAVHPDLIQLLGVEMESEPFFDGNDFRAAVAELAGADVEVPAESILMDYVNTFLIPHCLELCLYGNGPATRDARGSQGEYETAFGVSLHPEPSRPQPTPIPDPCLPLQDHSTEAVCHASAMLRRVRLLRASQYICGCSELAPELVVNLAKSKQMGDLRELPVWWCPWVHDVALLVQAATKGLFSVIRARSSHAVFAPDRVEDFLRSSLSSTDLPGSQYASSEKISSWIRKESETFPMLNQIERRLSFFCDVVTANATDAFDRYCSVPMFDHGGWPRV